MIQPLQTMWHYIYPTTLLLSVMHFAFMVEAQSDCYNGVVVSTSPIIYPSSGSYPPNAFCNWRMEVLAGTRVKTTFTSVSIESSTTPYNDFLLVFDGPTCTSPILAKITGSSTPTITSSDNSTSLMFISNAVTQSTGFTATFASTPTTATCGGTLTDDTGTLDGTNMGGGNICIWHINTASTRKVTLSVSEVKGATFDQWYKIFNGGTCANGGTKRFGTTIPAYVVQTNVSELVVVSYGIPIRATYTAGASLEYVVQMKYSMLLTIAIAWLKI